MTALTSFLLRNGLDVSSRSSELQQALQPFLLRAWRSSRDQKLKDALITCLSIQVKLGGLQVPMLGNWSSSLGFVHTSCCLLVLWVSLTTAFTRIAAVAAPPAQHLDTVSTVSSCPQALGLQQCNRHHVQSAVLVLMACSIQWLMWVCACNRKQEVQQQRFKGCLARRLVQQASDGEC